MSEVENRHVSGFVSILGRPNAGKSTLLNALVGMKVAIVADKPQTTRTSIQGVLTEPEYQIVFLDTPGIHKADSSIQKRMMDAVRDALDERDVLLFLVDASVPVSTADRHAVSLLQKSEAPAIAVFNKIDLIKEKAKLLPLIEEYQKLHPFAAFVPISARKNEGLAELKQEIVSRLPEGPQYFPEDHVTDQPERFLGAELIREKALQLTREEVPHSVAVLIDKWEETPQLTRIFATIYVERDGQKRILVGAKGSMLTQIGTLAREEMEKILGVRIYLSLFVKVVADWREKPAFLNAIDWRTMTGADEPKSLLSSFLLAVMLMLPGVSIAADKPVPDDHIYDLVRQKLAGDSVVKGGALIVDVKNGVVTLSGNVQSEKQKGKAEHLAHKVKGVKSVVNQIKVVKSL